MKRFCSCKDCRKARKRGYILHHRLLRHLGCKAYYVSDYVKYHRLQPGRKREQRAKQKEKLRHETGTADP